MALSEPIRHTAGRNIAKENALSAANPKLETLGEKELPEIPAAECFHHPKVLRGIRERFPTVKDLPWVEV